MSVGSLDGTLVSFVVLYLYLGKKELVKHRTFCVILN